MPVTVFRRSDFRHVVSIVTVWPCDLDISRRVGRHFDLPQIKPCGIRMLQPLGDQLFEVVQAMAKNVSVWNRAAPAKDLTEVVASAESDTCLGPLVN